MDINQWAGMEVVAHPMVGPVPKVQLSLDCPCTEPFRAEYNQWLKEFFGSEEKAFIVGNTAYISNAAYAMLISNAQTKNKKP